MTVVQFEDDWMTVLWQKVDYMVHLGLRPWYTSRCTSPPFCGVSRVITEPLHDCRTCKIANTTGLIFYHQWVEWLEQGSPGEDWPNPQHMQLQQLATDDLRFQLQSSGGRFDDDTSVSIAAEDVLHLPACPSGANHACCRMPTSCTSGQVCICPLSHGHVETHDSIPHTLLACSSAYPFCLHACRWSDD